MNSKAEAAVGVDAGTSVNGMPPQPAKSNPTQQIRMHRAYAEREVSVRGDGGFDSVLHRSECCFGCSQVLFCFVVSLSGLGHHRIGGIVNVVAVGQPFFKAINRTFGLVDRFFQSGSLRSGVQTSIGLDVKASAFKGVWVCVGRVLILRDF